MYTHKKIRSFYLYLPFILALLIFVSCSQKTKIQEYKDEINYTVLFFNDIHGTLLPFSEEEDGQVKQYGGIAHISALVKDIRTENQANDIPTLLLFAGDLLQGSLMSTMFKGYPDVLCFNEMGVNVMVIGNHEFDYGIPNFFHLKETADFPIISSNIYYYGELMGEPYIRLPIKGDTYLTVIGTTIDDIFNVADRNLLKGITTTDPIESIESFVSEYSVQGPVIVLSHNELEVERQIAEAYPGLTAVVTGHDHILLDPCLKVNDVPILQAYQKGKYLGRIDLSYNRMSGESRMISYNYYTINTDIREDERAGNIIADYEKELDAIFSDPIGYTEVFLQGERQKIRCEETNWGNFITDSVREFFDADIVFINSGSVRASINQGEITLGDVYNSLTFDNDIYTLEMTGEDILWILDKSFGINYNYGGFLMQAGLKITVMDGTVGSVYIISGGEELDQAKTYRVAINSFLAGGGDHYSIFTEPGRIKTKEYISLRDLVINTIIAKKTINPNTDGRIEFK